jgi:hypothetical protein
MKTKRRDGFVIAFNVLVLGIIILFSFLATVYAAVYV